MDLYSIKIHISLVSLWILISGLLLLLSPIILLMLVLRSSETIFYKRLYGGSKLNAPDLIWTMKRKEQLGVIIGMLHLDGSLDLPQCKDMLLKRLVNKRLNGKLLYPRVTQYISPGWINYYWLADPDFNIDNHVAYLTQTPISSDKKLKEIIEGLFCAPFKGKSPWEFLLVPYKKDNEESKTIILVRLEHSIGDGSSLAYFLMNSLADQEPNIESEESQSSTSKDHKVSKFSLGAIFFSSLVGLWYLPLVYVKNLTRKTDQNILHTPHLTCNKKVDWILPIPLETVKSIKNALKSTVNDVLVGVLSKSIDDYFQSQGAPGKSFTIFNAVNLRTHSPDGFDNQITSLLLSFPLGKPTTEGHIKALKSTFDVMKARKEPLGLILGWHFIGFILPVFLLEKLMFNEIDKTTGNVTNLIGPNQSIKIQGLNVDSLSFWQPALCNQAFSVSFCSFQGQIRISAQADSIVMNDPGIILNSFEKNFNKLAKKYL
ncbi:uncharacterized protein [Clytia hemisphaerica]|uniref:uncharacterized protein n=1 Tax=Clytia hemisphaerica TaxID=252671 RepID=UPI0034D62547